MKLTLFFAFLLLCCQIFWVSCDSSPNKVTGTGTVTTTTPKPWSKKIKSGLDNFFRGAAVVGVVQGAIQNGRSHKPKLSKH